jgi:hypothetical protein
MSCLLTTFASTPTVLRKPPGCLQGSSCSWLKCWSSAPAAARVAGITRSSRRAGTPRWSASDAFSAGENSSKTMTPYLDSPLEFVGSCFGNLIREHQVTPFPRQKDVATKEGSTT